MDKNEKWCIMITKENQDTLEQYLRNNKHKYSCYKDSWVVSQNGIGHYFLSESKTANHSVISINPDYTIISFEQFKQWFNPNQSDIPEYVEVIKKFSGSSGWWNIGDVYKVSHYRSDGISVVNIKGDTNGLGENHLEYLKKSTKEAFDLQNKPKVDFSNDSWCVDIREIDEEGREAYKNWLNRFTNYSPDFTCQYYGITVNKNIYYGGVNSLDRPKIISKEEFYQKIGYKPIEEKWIPKKDEYFKCESSRSGYEGKEGKVYKCIKVENRDGYILVFFDTHRAIEISRVVKPLSHEIPTNQSDPLLIYSTYKNFKLGDWVISLGDFISFKKGSIGQIIEVNDGYGLKAKSIKISTQTFTGECADEFRLATQDEIGKHLIEEAKKRYPPDTLFYPAHLPTVKDTCLRRPEYHFYYEKGYIYLRNEKNLVVNMNSGYSYCVYYNGTWAKVVNQSESMSKEELLAKAKTLYKIGDKILPLRPFGASGTYGEDTISNALQYNDEGIYGGIGYVYLFKTSQWAEIISKPEVKKEVELVNHSDVGLEYPLSCGSYGLNNTKIEYVDYTYNGNYNEPKSKVNELKVLSQQIPVVFKKKVKKHFLQTI